MTWATVASTALVLVSHRLPRDTVLRADGDFACPDSARWSPLAGCSVFAVLHPLFQSELSSRCCLRRHTCVMALRSSRIGASLFRNAS